MATKSKPKPKDAGETPVRRRILEAAFSVFMERGFVEASTLEIATRARASKRELYALFGSKQDMLIACIGERAKRFELPAELPAPRDRKTLARVLAAFGSKLLREVSDPVVITVFRLAIAEAIRAPEVALALNAAGVSSAVSDLRGAVECGPAANHDSAHGLAIVDPAGQICSGTAVEIEGPAGIAKGGLVEQVGRKDVSFAEAGHLFAQRNVDQTKGIVGWGMRFAIVHGINSREGILVGKSLVVP